jgi:uncharacterized membrane protein YwzB
MQYLFALSVLFLIPHVLFQKAVFPVLIAFFIEKIVKKIKTFSAADPFFYLYPAILIKQGQ